MHKLAASIILDGVILHNPRFAGVASGVPKKGQARAI
jgi:hypothetical protein